MLYQPHLQRPPHQFGVRPQPRNDLGNHLLDVVEAGGHDFAEFLHTHLHIEMGQPVAVTRHGGESRSMSSRDNTATDKRSRNLPVLHDAFSKSFGKDMPTKIKQSLQRPSQTGLGGSGSPLVSLKGSQVLSREPSQTIQHISNPCGPFKGDPGPDLRGRHRRSSPSSSASSLSFW
jgi:hypothetical protein